MKTDNSEINPMRESVKIRHWVMNLIYQHPNERILIPGSNELAAKFGVARSTVTLVLKALTDEGYLEGRRGIGTFTKHQNFIPVGGRMPPLIGILAGDGKYFYYPYQVWAVIATAGMELTRHGCNVRPLLLNGGSEEALLEEISRQYLDGVIVADVSPRRGGLLQRLRSETHLAVVSQIGCRAPADFGGGNCYRVDPVPAGVEIGRQMIAEGRSRLFFVFLNNFTALLLDGIEQAFRDAGKTLDKETFDWAQNDVYQMLRERLATAVPDAIFVHGEHYETVCAMLAELGIDERRCRLYGEAHVMRSGRRHWAVAYPYEELGRLIAARMLALCAGNEEPVALPELFLPAKLLPPEEVLIAHR